MLKQMEIHLFGWCVEKPRSALRRGFRLGLAGRAFTDRIACVQYNRCCDCRDMARGTAQDAQRAAPSESAAAETSTREFKPCKPRSALRHSAGPVSR